MKTDGNIPATAQDVEELMQQFMLNSIDDNAIDLIISQAELSVSDAGAEAAETPAEDVCLRSISIERPDEEMQEKAAAKPVKPDKPAALHKDHRAKVRQRFLEEGLNGFQKHNILELLLFYARPRVDTNEIAHRLLNFYHGNLSEVLGADVRSLAKIEGVGESAAILLSMMPQVFRIYREELIKRKGISGRPEVEQYVANRFTGEPVEKVLIVCLDNKWHLLGDEFVSSGSVNFSSVDRRAIIEMCLRYNCTAAVIAHNHPRGTALPSREDLTTTIEIRRALDLIGVRLMGHIIVAGEDYVSLSCSKKYCALF